MRSLYLSLTCMLCLILDVNNASGQWLSGPGGSIHNANNGPVRIGTNEDAGGNAFLVSGNVGVAANASYGSPQLVFGYSSNGNYGQIFANDVSGSSRNLMINATGGNVGIRTTTATHPLTVAGQIKSTIGGFVLPDGTVIAGDEDLGGGPWTDGMVVTYPPTNYKVGIGTTNPQKTLEVAGDIRVTGHQDWYANRNFNLIGGGEWSYDFQDTDGSDLWHVWRPTYGTVLSARNNGRVGIGTGAPETTLHVKGAVRGNNNGALRIDTGSGYVDIGPQNTSYAHLFTDRVAYYFNKELRVDTGHIGSHNEDLKLRTSGVDRIFVRQTDGFVGIGTSGPTALLDVNGDVIAGSNGGNLYVGAAGDRIRIDASGSTGYMAYQSGIRAIDFDEDETWLHGGDLFVNATGLVGIGVTTPTEKLHVNGKVRASEGFVLPDGTVIDSFGDVGLWSSAHGGVFYEGGNVGIGTDTPQTLLSVDGTVTAKEIVVTTDGWADFVLDGTYQPMGLSKLDAFIKQYKHLPNIPTEDDVAENGLAVGALQSRLLQKIEELTLYVIKLDRENTKIRRRIASLEFPDSAAASKWRQP
jgi:hypothetical protein